MGRYRRTYVQHDGGGSGFGLADWPVVCRWIVFLNVAVFLSILLIRRGPEPYYPERWEVGDEDVAEFLTRVKAGWRSSPLQEWLQLETPKVLRGQVWRLLTCAFCHDRHNLWHIVMNMLGLIWFGIPLERMYGSREFLMFYLVSALAAGLAFIGLELFRGSSVPAIGASGAVMSVLMLYACHFPEEEVWLFFVFPIRIRWLVAIYVAFDLHPVLLTLAGDKVDTCIAHAAHLGGLGFGFLYWRRNLRLEPLIGELERIRFRSLFRRNPGLKIHRPPDNQTSPPEPDSRIDPAVDRLLEKISRQGRENLTSEELDLLVRESQRLRSRLE